MASRTKRLESHVCKKLFNTGKIWHHGVTPRWELAEEINVMAGSLR